MSRPLYETPEHLQAETDFKEVIERERGVTLVKLPIDWKVDFAVNDKNNTTIGFLEIKCSNHLSTQYEKFIITQHKFDHALNLLKRYASDRYKPMFFILAVRFLDRDLYYKYNPDDVSSFDYRVSGRTDRQDPKDIQPHVFIPISLFQPVQRI